MNKWIVIVSSIIVSAFLAINGILLFGANSTIQKHVQVSTYEKLMAQDLKKELQKEGFVTPADITTLYVNEEDSLSKWLVKQGDYVGIGEQLAELNKSVEKQQRTKWAAEQSTLKNQISQVENSIARLQLEQFRASQANESNATSTSTEENVQVNVKVDVTQNGTFSQAIADSERELAKLEQQLQLVNQQLTQPEGQTHLLSPMEGVVATIQDQAIEIYSLSRTVTTFVTENEWSRVKKSNQAIISGSPFKSALNGKVAFVSEIQAESSEWLKAYHSIAASKDANPLGYYAVQVEADDSLASMPFASQLKLNIITDQAKNAYALREQLLFDRKENEASAFLMTNEGTAEKVKVAIAFDLHKESVITEGLDAGQVVLGEDSLNKMGSMGAVILPMPIALPKWQTVKNTSWKTYLSYLLK